MNWGQRLRQGEWRLQTTPVWNDAVRDTSADAIMDWQTTSDFHTKQGRSTGRIALNAGELPIYLKRHWQLPWWQRLAASVYPSGQWTPAAVEWANLSWAQSVGISVPEPLAKGEQTGPGMQLRSFLAIRELTGMLALHQAIPLAFSLMSQTTFAHWKRQLLVQVAEMARRLHGLHRFHKDLYLCHFYVAKPEHDSKSPGPLSLIDLHRLGHHRLWNWYWQIKDLAQLYYSTWGVAGLNDEDRLALFQNYLGTSNWSARDRWLYQAVVFKAKRYARHNRISTVDAPMTQGLSRPGRAA